ncbi:hypothetical protein ACFLTG_02880 [Chloroflexota bacterium]
MYVGQKVRIIKGEDKGKKGTIQSETPSFISPLSEIFQSMTGPVFERSIAVYRVKLDDGEIKSYPLNGIEFIDE